MIISMVPLQKPKLPTVDKLLPYLKRMDESRWYSNFGPMVREYEGRLADMFGVPVVAASSATSALTATLMAMDLPQGCLIACPSWTFVATPASIVAAGHIPYFYDVGMDPASLPVAAIMLVAAFGHPAIVPDTNLPMVIDAAAGFDSYRGLMGSIPTIVSTHATKVFSTGEGGFVACNSVEFLDKVRIITNNGYAPNRDAPVFGINAKMSEYHAAVGLAELDGWEDKRLEWLELDTHPYATSMKEIVNGMGYKRHIYGCHTLTAYRCCPRTSMAKTEKLMENITFFPKWID